MTTPDLGRLRSVPLQEIWPHEALNFTPWLLENTDVLADVLSMDLVLEEAEHPVGRSVSTCGVAMRPLVKR